MREGSGERGVNRGRKEERGKIREEDIVEKRRG